MTEEQESPLSAVSASGLGMDGATPSSCSVASVIDHAVPSFQPPDSPTNTPITTDEIPEEQPPRPVLKPISPEESIDWYLSERHPEVRTETHRSLRSALHIFQEWTQEIGLQNLNELDGRLLRRFRKWRRSRTDIELITLNANLVIVKRFLKFAEEIEAVPEGLAEKTPLPNVQPEDEIRTTVPADGLVESVTEQLKTYRPNSRVHLEHAIIRTVGLRVGALRAIDLDDYNAEQGEIRLKHRPMSGHPKGTPLKNGNGGQRLINISNSVLDHLDAYIAGQREAIEDRFGRSPLFTTNEGRVTISTIRRDFYKLSRPCIFTNECPHDRVIDNCEATYSDLASKCPSSYSPHPLRAWSIMDQLDRAVPIDKLSNRVDVSVPVLEKHYDLRSETRKGRSRRAVLREHLEDY